MRENDNSPGFQKKTIHKFSPFDSLEEENDESTCKIEIYQKDKEDKGKDTETIEKSPKSNNLSMILKGKRDLLGKKGVRT